MFLNIVIRYTGETRNTENTEITEIPLYFSSDIFRQSFYFSSE